MIEQYVKSAREKMEASLQHLEDELSQVRGSRASAGLLDGVKVEVYGQSMPIKSLASINTPDVRTILVTPWDKANLASIEKAIREDTSLGLNPASDGNMVKLNLPALTQERREQLAKLVSEKLEGAKVSLRNTRHDVLKEGRRDKDAKTITDDDLRGLENRLNELIEEKNKEAEKLLEAKRAELMEI